MQVGQLAAIGTLLRTFMFKKDLKIFSTAFLVVEQDSLLLQNSKDPRIPALIKKIARIY